MDDPSPGRRINPWKSISECMTEGGVLLPEANCVPLPGDGSPHGAYFWDQLETILYVKIKGGRHLEVRAEPVVMVSATLALSIEDFYQDR